MRRIAALAFCAVLIFGTALWGQQLKKVTIGVDIHGLANAYWNQELEGVKLFAASLPPGTATVQALISNGDPNTELQNIKNLVAAKGTDVIFYIDPAG